VAVIVRVGTIAVSFWTSDIMTTSFEVDVEGAENVNDGVGTGPTPHTGAIVGETGGAFLRPRFDGPAPRAELAALRFVPRDVPVAGARV
jgi:hypothetical protein